MSQSGSAFWTCTQCGGMGSVLDRDCPICGADRPAAGSAPVTPTASSTAVPPTPATQPAPSVIPPPAAPAVTVTGVSGNWSQRACMRCGSTQSIFAWRCTQCAGRLSYGPRTSAAQPSRVMAIVLAFALGIFGAHHLYMGRRALFYVSLALCWSGLTTVVSTFDGLRMLFLSDDEFWAECA